MTGTNEIFSIVGTNVLRLSSSGNEASEGVDEGVRGQGGTRFQMTGAGDEAGENQAVVFLSSFSVDNEEWSKRIDSGVVEQIWRICGWKSASGVRAPSLARRFRRESGGIGSNDN